MPNDRVSVLAIGAPFSSEDLILSGMANYEESGFDVVQLLDDKDIYQALAENYFNAIITFGDVSEYENLNGLQLAIRQQWLHYEDLETPPVVVANDIMATFMSSVTTKRFPGNSLVSVFTPTFKTESSLIKPYVSLCEQTYDNWEWIIYDDSPDDRTFKIAEALASFDHRIKVFKSTHSCGRIGEVKRRCCGLASGEIFVELDHDDELTNNCLADIVQAFNEFPEAGFVYTDCAEVLENGENATYPEGYAFGFGSYRKEFYNGRAYMVANYPSVNSKTVRHIVGMPNHARAWRRDAYFAAGGHSPEVHVADDYELCIRTFLTTRMVHVRRFGYIQNIDSKGSNTQRVRNREIQRLVKYFSDHYNQSIHDRFVELGVDDFIWTDSGLDWNLSPSENFQANYNFD